MRVGKRLLDRVIWSKNWEFPLKRKKVVDESNRWLHVTGQSKIPVFYARLVVPLIILIHLKQFAD